MFKIAGAESVVGQKPKKKGRPFRKVRTAFCGIQEQTSSTQIYI